MNVMQVERLRELAQRFDQVGVGGLFTRAEQQELCSLALEAAALLDAHPAPEPLVMALDWANAPDWAGWGSVNPSGLIVWSDLEPFIELVGFAGWHVDRGARWHVDKPIEIPLGTDWRMLKQHRPVAGGGE